MDNRAKVNYIRLNTIELLKKYLFFLFLQITFVKHFCSQISMSATMTTMFVMLTQTVSTPSAPTTASVKKVILEMDNRAKVHQRSLLEGKLSLQLLSLLRDPCFRQNNQHNNKILLPMFHVTLLNTSPHLDQNPNYTVPLKETHETFQALWI